MRKKRKTFRTDDHETLGSSSSPGSRVRNYKGNDLVETRTPKVRSLDDKITDDPIWRSGGGPPCPLLIQWPRRLPIPYTLRLTKNSSKSWVEVGVKVSMDHGSQGLRTHETSKTSRRTIENTKGRWPNLKSKEFGLCSQWTRKQKVESVTQDTRRVKETEIPSLSPLTQFTYTS